MTIYGKGCISNYRNCSLSYVWYSVLYRMLTIMNTFGSITYEFFNNKKNYHFDLTGAFSNIIEESEAIEYDDDDDEDEFDDDDDD